MKRSDAMRVVNERWSECRRCELHKCRTQVVHFRGSIGGKLAIIGEAPGEEEDLKGKPFVGRSGKLLDELLIEADINPRRDVFVCNTLGCRPPHNRAPDNREIIACKPRVRTMLGAIVQPGALLLLGASAAKLAGVRGITKVRGQRCEVEFIGAASQRDYKFPAVPTFHPSYLLRTHSPTVRAQMIHDIRYAYNLAWKGV